MGIINGHKNPLFKLVKDSSTYSGVELPLTNSAGLVEDYEIVKIKHDLLQTGSNGNNNVKTVQKILGYRIYWTLYYNEFITGESLLLIKQILEHEKSGGTLMLTPRADHKAREFEVYTSMNNFSLGLRKGGAKAKFHRLPVLQFATVNIEQDLKWALELTAGTYGGEHKLPYTGEIENN